MKFPHLSEQGIVTVFHFIVDGLEKIVEVVSQGIQEAFRNIQGILLSFGVSFANTFSFLGELLPLDKIGKTKEVISSGLETTCKLRIFFRVTRY